MREELLQEGIQRASLRTMLELSPAGEEARAGQGKQALRWRGWRGQEWGGGNTEGVWSHWPKKMLELAAAKWFRTPQATVTIRFPSKNNQWWGD